jgi:GGDEF domain-containing protein
MRPVPQPLVPSQSEAPDDGQEMLDELPIPAAEIGLEEGGPASILRANDSFRSLVRHDERLRGPLVADVPLLGLAPIASALRDVLHRGAPLQQFDAETGRGGDAQLLAVRIAILSGTPTHPYRCLLTLLDTGCEPEPERGLRPEPARDPLTGLPSRRAFEERVAEVLEHPNFEAGSHALVTASLNEHRQPPSDELLIAAAGRLLSALRAGDLLARTGEGSFAMLTRLERGQGDAAELVDRLKKVLARPFRLSDTEATITCSVDSAPLA